MQIITTPQAPQAIGPYSQAVVHNGMLYSSGQIGLDSATMTMVEGIENQTQQVLKNIDAVLQAGGTNKKNVIKTTILLSDLIHFQTVNGIYESYFEGHKPARSTVQVAGLPKGALIEIEVIAFIG